MEEQAPQDPGARKDRRTTHGHTGITALRLVTLATCLTFALMLATAPPREAPMVGTIGAGCSYELDERAGTLTIHPTDGVSGEMARVRDALPDEDLRHAVKSVTVEEGVLAPADSGYLFGGLYAMEALDLSGLDTSRVTDMHLMFYVCSSLTSLDLSPLDTSQVTNVSSPYGVGMFSNCSSLRSLDLSPLDTSQVTDMRRMFDGCFSLRSIDLSGLDTSRVTNMSEMFSDCSSLTSLDLSPLKTSRVIDMRSMFYGCASLASLDTSHLDTSKVTGMSGMFCGCASLPSLDLSGWDTSGVGGMWGMFQGCASLSSLAVGERCGNVLSTDMHTSLPAGVGGMGWHSERDKRWLTTGELSSSRRGVADTYTAPEAWRSLVSPQAATASP